MKNKSITTIILTFIICISAIIATLYYAVNQFNKVEIAQNKVAKIHDKLRFVNSDNVIYQVDANDNYSTYTINVIKNINKIMEKMLNYTSGDDYLKTRQALTKVILDKKFFDNYYKSPLNENDENVIDILNIKSKVRSVNTYNLKNGQYLVVVNYIQYHNESDLNHIDNLRQSYQGYVISANKTQITSIEPTNELSMIS